VFNIQVSGPYNKHTMQLRPELGQSVALNFFMLGVMVVKVN
jgi:hypothetical protein